MHGAPGSPSPQPARTTTWNPDRYRDSFGLATLGPAWRRGDDEIVADFECENFAAAIALVDRIAAAAELADHHPDILVHAYRQLKITLATHSAGASPSSTSRWPARSTHLLRASCAGAPPLDGDANGSGCDCLACYR